MLNFLSYIIILILTFIYAYIFDVKESYILFYMMLFMPLFDYLYFLLYRRKLEVTANIATEYMTKNQMNMIEVNFINKSIFPIVYFSYEIRLGDKLTSNEILNGANSLMGKKTLIREIPFRANYIGLDEIIVQNIEVKSLFGLFSNKLKGTFEEFKVNIIPNIVNVDRVESLIEDEISSDGDVESSANVIKGEPGYEYKEYHDGEPLAKVNWKISSKMNNLFIRKDEAYSKCKKVIILDDYLNCDENQLMIQDLLIEGAIGLVSEMHNYDFEVELYYMKETKWIKKIINWDGDIKILQKDFASYRFGDNLDRFKGLLIQKDENIDIIILTSNKDSAILKFIDTVTSTANSIYIVSNNINRIQENEFYLTNDYCLERLR